MPGGPRPQTTLTKEKPKKREKDLLPKLNRCLLTNQNPEPDGAMVYIYYCRHGYKTTFSEYHDPWKPAIHFFKNRNKHSVQTRYVYFSSHGNVCTVSLNAIAGDPSLRTNHVSRKGIAPAESTLEQHLEQSACVYSPDDDVRRAAWCTKLFLAHWHAVPLTRPYVGRLKPRNKSSQISDPPRNPGQAGVKLHLRHGLISGYTNVWAGGVFQNEC